MAIELLPEHLRAKSFSTAEIVLPHDDALEAVRLLEQSGWAILSWEGWMSYPDGRLGHASRFQGTVEVGRKSGESWESYVQRTARFCRDTMGEANREWELTRGKAGTKLLFCITAWSRDEGGLALT